MAFASSDRFGNSLPVGNATALENARAPRLGCRPSAGRQLRFLHQLRNLLEQRALCWDEFDSSLGDGKPRAPIDFWIFAYRAGFRRPFEREAVALKLRRIKIACRCPGGNHFAAALLDRPEGLKRAAHR